MAKAAVPVGKTQLLGDEQAQHIQAAGGSRGPQNEATAQAADNPSEHGGHQRVRDRQRLHVPHAGQHGKPHDAQGRIGHEAASERGQAQGP